jgi:hypothetical protein
VQRILLLFSSAAGTLSAPSGEACTKRGDRDETEDGEEMEISRAGAGLDADDEEEEEAEAQQQPLLALLREAGTTHAPSKELVNAAAMAEVP